jgi:hypothetical protein
VTVAASSVASRSGAEGRLAWRRAIASSAAVAPTLVRWWARRVWGLRPRAASRLGVPSLTPVSRRDVSDLDWEAALARRHPVLLSGVVDRWPLFHRSTPDGLREVLGREWVSVLVATAASRDFGRAWLSGSRVRMTVASLLDEIFTKEPSHVRYYAWSVGLGSLASDVDRPDAIGGRAYLPGASSLWIGQAGNLTSLHYDHWHGFLGQLVGRKRFVLFAPDETARLSAHSPFSPLSASTRLPADCLQAPASDFPRFDRARGWDVTLEPGDLLYVPPYWWHQAECIDASISLTLRYDLTTREAAQAGALPRRILRARRDLEELRARLRSRRDRAGDEVRVDAERAHG